MDTILFIEDAPKLPVLLRGEESSMLWKELDPTLNKFGLVRIDSPPGVALTVFVRIEELIFTKWLPFKLVEFFSVWVLSPIRAANKNCFFSQLCHSWKGISSARAFLYKLEILKSLGYCSVWLQNTLEALETAKFIFTAQAD